MKKLTILLPAFFIIWVSCSKKDAATAPVAPSNLSISAVVSTDSSGNVTFTFSADNAVSYNFDFGNNIKQQDNTGNLVYKYPFSGTYTVTVTAVGSGGQTISKTTSAPNEKPPKK